jgi:hypothetical protein
VALVKVCFLPSVVASTSVFLIHSTKESIHLVPDENTRRLPWHSAFIRFLVVFCQTQVIFDIGIVCLKLNERQACPGPLV